MNRRVLSDFAEKEKLKDGGEDVDTIMQATPSRHHTDSRARDRPRTEAQRVCEKKRERGKKKRRV